MLSASNQLPSLPNICSLWIGGELSPLERLTAASFLAQGHKFILYAYESLSGLPNGVILEDANMIISEEQVFLSRGSYAHFADWFRWKMLCELGGLWVDMDVVCIRPFSFCPGDIVFGYESGDLPNVAVLGFPPGHPACIEMEDRCRDPHKCRPEDSARERLRKFKRRYFQGNQRALVKWGQVGGPMGFRGVLNRHGLLKEGLPFTFFYPVHWTNAAAMFDATMSKDKKMFFETRGIHLWNEVLRRQGIDKNGPFRKDSLIYALLEEHGI